MLINRTKELILFATFLLMIEIHKIIITLISPEILSILHNEKKQKKHRIVIYSACDGARPIIANTRVAATIKYNFIVRPILFIKYHLQFTAENTFFFALAPLVFKYTNALNYLDQYFKIFL